MNSQSQYDFSPADMFSRAIRYWWLAVVLMVAGGLIGLLVSVIAKPVFESTADITTVIDFAYSGKLTSTEEDHLLAAIGDVIQSDGVMDRVISETIDAGYARNSEGLVSALTASRQGYRWELSSRFPDPDNAYRVNTIWLNAALEALEQFRLNSIAAIGEYNAQVGIENCFQQAVVLEPVSAFCSASDFQALREQIDSMSSPSNRRTLLTRLLASRISFEVTNGADLPLSPVHRGWNTSVMAGAIAGLIASIALFVTGFPSIRKSDKSQ